MYSARVFDSWPGAHTIKCASNKRQHHNYNIWISINRPTEKWIFMIYVHDGMKHIFCGHWNMYILLVYHMFVVILHIYVYVCAIYKIELLLMLLDVVNPSLIKLNWWYICCYIHVFNLVAWGNASRTSIWQRDVYK